MNRTEVELSCHCKKWFYNGSTVPREGEDLYCIYHKRGVTVMTSGTNQWHVKCLKCTYSRYHGQARLSAERAGARHRRAHPTHVVVVYKPDGSVHYRYDNRGQLTLEEEG